MNKEMVREDNDLEGGWDSQVQDLCEYECSSPEIPEDDEGNNENGKSSGVEMMGIGDD